MATTVLADRYELDQRLGSGGMAEVWRGRDLRLGRRVAVKTVRLSDGADVGLLDQVRREAVATAALEHPGIVRVYDAGVTEDVAFLVMEYLRGRTLASYIRDRPLEVAHTVYIGARVAAALSAAHGAGIVHRDIKPANIVLDGEHVTLVDFGIAAVEHQTVASLSAPGTTLGTAEYMAPEQARAEPVSRATDMYAFGCLITATLAGRPPFRAAQPEDLLHRHAYVQPPRLASQRPDVPGELDELVWQLLAKEPDERPSAGEAHTVLARMAGLPTLPDLPDGVLDDRPGAAAYRGKPDDGGAPRGTPGPDTGPADLSTAAMPAAERCERG
ncbi:hypothetical protein GCM10023169_03090 [Georgenia halophila]|uniref:non-specific serine/threonine protein kinase n=1 Tax=Georgenia halophila TaxID=620889 RepID=A0ABP8KTG8_9MICO